MSIIFDAPCIYTGHPVDSVSHACVVAKGGH